MNAGTPQQGILIPCFSSNR